ncbi:sensor histidine kinase [Streptomyces sp. NPDC056656]|uniref:sensor histidine kinase n=1 Tax=Streptomyces sp. NPDC056656 TaxID=3345895 RepID=UPI00367D1017
MKVGIPNVYATIRPTVAFWMPAVITAVLGVLTLQVVDRGDVRALDAGQVLLVVASSCALLMRRRFPVPALAVVLLLSVVNQAVGAVLDVMIPAIEVAVYTVALRTGRLGAWATAALTTVWVAVTVLVFQPGLSTNPQRLGAVAWIIAAAAVGDAVRSRRAVVAALRERAERAEQTRAEEAARQVAEERVRIASDLHDIVAHQLTLIHAQAGVGVHLENTGVRRPDGLLEQIREGAKVALEELRTTVGALSQGVDGGPQSLQPTPGLSALDDLTRSFALAGLQVEVRRRGEPGRPSATVDVTAFRILQEALTNVHKHAQVDRAEVGLSWGTAALVLNVRSGPSLRSNHVATAGTHRGLLSMKERAAAVGGTCEAGPVQGGGYLVTAVLPLHENARMQPVAAAGTVAR